MKQSLLVAALLAIALGGVNRVMRPAAGAAATPTADPVEHPLDNQQFPNLMGDAAMAAAFEAELTAAQVTPVNTPVPMGECRARVIGLVNEAGWTFTREHNYWRAEGPGLPLAYAAQLHASHGDVVRVDGDGKDPAALNGFGATLYHIDTPAGLRALAATLRRVAADQ